VAIESLATGTPVIARRAGALPEIVEHGVDGFLVDDLAEAKLAVTLVGDLDRARIRERAIERFDVDRMVGAYERLYRTLIDGATHDGASDRRDPDDEEERDAETVALSGRTDRGLVGIPIVAAVRDNDGRR
jgi:hypothetical protein